MDIELINSIADTVIRNENSREKLKGYFTERQLDEIKGPERHADNDTANCLVFFQLMNKKGPDFFPEELTSAQLLKFLEKLILSITGNCKMRLISRITGI